MKDQHLVLVIVLLFVIAYKTWQAYSRGQVIKQLEIAFDKSTSDAMKPNPPSESFRKIYGQNPSNTNPYL